MCCCTVISVLSTSTQYMERSSSPLGACCAAPLPGKTDRPPSSTAAQSAGHLALVHMAHSTLWACRWFDSLESAGATESFPAAPAHNAPMDVRQMRTPE